MAINTVSIKCPECGATAEVEEGRQQIFCSYCGSKIMIQNDNEYIHRHIDEASIKQAETEQMVQLKRLELAEKKRADREKANSIKIKISIPLGIIMLIAFAWSYVGSMSMGGLMVGMVCALALMLMWMNNNKEDEDVDLGYKVKVPSISDYQSKSYTVIEARFRSAGFTNIKCVPLNDLTVGLLKKPGMVESIMVNGNAETSGGRKCLPDVKVVISYHSHR